MEMSERRRITQIQVDNLKQGEIGMGYYESPEKALEASNKLVVDLKAEIERLNGEIAKHIMIHNVVNKEFDENYLKLQKAEQRIKELEEENEGLSSGQLLCFRGGSSYCDQQQIRIKKLEEELKMFRDGRMIASSVLEKLNKEKL